MDDPGGGENYGESFIGYRKTAQVEVGAPGDSSGNGSATDGGAWDGNGSGAGGSTASGGATGWGGMGGGAPLLDASSQPLARPSEKPVLENPFVAAASEATSTFSIDVDSGSYTLARASVSNGFLPDPSLVRVEEFLNYFHFHYQEPTGDKPLALYRELGDCPWNSKRKLLLLGVQGQEVSLEAQPPLQLVYLLDVSGSMNEPHKLPLLKQGFRMLTRRLRPQDRVSIITYAGADQVVLEGASGSDQSKILAALDNLESGGSTNGAGGIQRAYEIAQKHFIEGGSNRILLATDGDFNVGLSNTNELVEFIAQKRKSGVDLSVYGYGSAWDGGNYRDEVAEQLADNGNGVYFFIDGEEETRRAFGYAMSGSLMTVARDVKLQVEFNPERVKGYRLIGYENRLLSNDDFGDDDVDAGELSAGLSVTALYEIIPRDSSEELPRPVPGTENRPPSKNEDESDDEAPSAAAGGSGGARGLAFASDELAQIRLRYKPSFGAPSALLETAISPQASREKPSAKFSFAAGVAEFAQRLRGSQYVPERGEAEIVEQLESALGLDREGAVKEARDFFKAAQRL